MPNTPQYSMIPVDSLEFDISNPRLIEFTIPSTISEKDLIKLLWENMDVREVALSIAASGFFSNDPLIATPDGAKFTVIEGNRRLAAVKLLQSPDLFKDIISDIPTISDTNKATIDKLPVFIQDRKDAWKFLGFKHVNGPAKWGSYAKAKYIAEVHNSYSIPLDQIASQIGDTNKTVQRLYHGLMVIEQAEEEKIYSREDTVRASIPFSHLYVGLTREGMRTFLALDDSSYEKKRPVPKEKARELGEVCRWLFGSRRDKVEPIIQSQNPDLKYLDAILLNREALAALRGGESLGAAYELTRPVSMIFEEQLLDAKRCLVKARGLLSEGYDGSEGLLTISESISTISSDLFDEMTRKNVDNRKKRKVE